MYICLGVHCINPVIVRPGSQNKERNPQIKIFVRDDNPDTTNEDATQDTTPISSSTRGTNGTSVVLPTTQIYPETLLH